MIGQDELSCIMTTKVFGNFNAKVGREIVHLPLFILFILLAKMSSMKVQRKKNRQINFTASKDIGGTNFLKENSELDKFVFQVESNRLKHNFSR